MSMAAAPVVEQLDVIEQVAARFLATAVDATSHSFFFKLLKKDSVTELSQQLPRRLMLISRPCLRQNRRQSSLPHCTS